MRERKHRVKEGSKLKDELEWELKEGSKLKTNSGGDGIRVCGDRRRILATY